MKLFFQMYGQGFPLLILHGLFGSLDNWLTLSRRFAEKFKVYALDLRNHGRSPHSNVFSYETMADDIREFFDDQGLSSAYIIGHSMGGKTAMRFALDHPDRLRRLVIVDIAPKGYTGHHDDILDALTTLDLYGFTSRKEIDTALAVKLPGTATRQFLLKNLKRDDEGRFFWKMNLEIIRKNYEKMNAPIESTAPFRRPTLFLRSTTSNYIGHDDIPPIKNLFPASTLVDFNVGHWIHAEAPDRFGAIVLDFLSQPG